MSALETEVCEEPDSMQGMSCDRIQMKGEAEPLRNKLCDIYKLLPLVCCSVLPSAKCVVAIECF